MNKYTDIEIVNGLSTNDLRVVDHIYKVNIRSVYNLVQNNRGSLQDAEDIFQEALYQVYCRIKEGDFVIKCSFRTFLYAICKNLWLKELRRRSKIELKREDCDNLSSESSYNHTSELAKEILFRQSFEMISLQCRKLLKLYFNRLAVGQIQEIMGYSSVQHTLNRKYICTKRLIQKIEETKEYKAITNELH